MHRSPFFHWLLLIALTACASPQTETAPASFAFYALRFTPPALLEFSPDLSAIQREISLPLLPGCIYWRLDPAPRGRSLAIELACASGPLVQILDLETGGTQTPIAEAGVDSHFLAWHPQGAALYLKIDTFGDPRLVRADLAEGKIKPLPFPATTYDLAIPPDGSSLLYSLTAGLGFGSETWLAEADGGNAQRLLADAGNIIAFARWSPEGERIAFIKIPDTQTPFAVGELWLMGAEGENAHFLAAADAGHGYAPAWSPDGTQIAFVVRENPDDTQADQSAERLVSNIYLVEVASGQVAAATRFSGALVEAPVWSPDGRSIAFDARIDGTINIWIHDLSSGETSRLSDDPACCPVWIGK